MKLFDIIGPVMIGPSSSHTAGAVKIGLIARKLLGKKPVSAKITLHGSFAMTGAGHGTDRALVAGILGIAPDDTRIAQSFDIATQNNLSFDIEPGHIPNVHPNSTQIILTDENNHQLDIVASSLGGGRIVISKIDGISAQFSGDENTLVVHTKNDRPGHLARVTNVLSQHKINIATLQLNRPVKGGQAVIIIECDNQITDAVQKELLQLDGMLKINYINKDTKED